MSSLRKIDIGVLIAFITALVGGVYFIGGLNTDVENMKDLRGDYWKKLKKDAIADIDAATGSLDTCPVGTIVAYAGRTLDVDNLPEAWRLCDGSPVPDGPEYEKLRTVLASAEWGKGGNKFCLPDLRGLFLRGVDDPDGEGGNPPAGKDDDGSERVYGTKKGGAVGSYQEYATHLPQAPFVISVGPHGHGVWWKGPNSQATNEAEQPFAFDAITRVKEPKPIEGKESPIIDMPEHDLKIEGGDKETRPKNRYVNWIIRVK